MTSDLKLFFFLFRKTNPYFLHNGKKTQGINLKMNFCIFPDGEMELGYLAGRLEYLVMTSSV